MAPLEVIGAGFGRTGTDSLRTALNMLGYVYSSAFAILRNIHATMTNRYHES